VAEPPTGSFDAAVADHDRRLAEAGLVVWVGSEPTFTDRMSFDPAWHGEAIGGGEKEQLARRMASSAAASLGGALLVRTIGRQYSGEALPRWCYGIYARRDGSPVWSGPPDPLSATPASHAAGAVDGRHAVDRLRASLADELTKAGWQTSDFEVDVAPRARVAFAASDGSPLPSTGEDPELARPSLHAMPLDPAGPFDALAARGVFLVGIGLQGDVDPSFEDAADLRVELPACPDVPSFAALLGHLAAAAADAGVERMVLAGYPPPVDETVAFETITPDPGVIEVNMSPCPDATGFLGSSRALYGRAETLGLSPFRIYFNGDVTDSGGGGHVTLGGPTPDRSPFFLGPHVLPRWIAYVMRHPSLSYWFAREGAGSSSQSPRADETTPENYEELALTIDLLARTAAPTAEQLWASLAPFMADRFGNTHRAEINVEKLWNPHLPGRGRLGLVELRALGMARSPESGTARVVLLRGLLAMLACNDGEPELVRWGSELHDRFALPFYLRRDLQDVFEELADSGFALGDPVTETLLADRDDLVGSCALEDLLLEVRRGIEFWPLVGDLGAQSGTSRLVDASAERLEIVLRPRDGDADRLAGWRMSVAGYELPVVRDHDRVGPALVLGVRYRRFVPNPGLHPLLDGHGGVEFICCHSDRSLAWKVTTHSWAPAGGAYDGLPVDQEEADRRRGERFSVAATACPDRIVRPRRGIVTPHCFDTRWL